MIIILEQGAYEFKLLKKFKAHTRILWSCDWAPNDAFFVTGSRDKSVRLPAVIYSLLIAS